MCFLWHWKQCLFAWFCFLSVIIWYSSVLERMTDAWRVKHKLTERYSGENSLNHSPNRSAFSVMVKILLCWKIKRHVWSSVQLISGILMLMAQNPRFVRNAHKFFLIARIAMKKDALSQWSGIIFSGMEARMSLRSAVKQYQVVLNAPKTVPHVSNARINFRWQKIMSANFDNQNEKFIFN